jgi:hypothetical protein
MIKIILGMDISTTCTGVSLLKYDTDTEEKQILYIGSVKFKVSKDLTSEESLFVKSKQFTDDFIAKYKDIGITDICIESPLATSNNALTCLTLGRFNGMLSQSIYEATGIAPHYISSFDARKYGFPSLTSVRRYDKSDNQYQIEKIRKAIKKNELTPFGSYTYSTDKKYILWELINEQFQGISWQYNKKGDLKKENFDASDSLVASLGWINKCKYDCTEPQIINSSEEEISDEDGNKFTKITYTVEFCGEQHTKSMIF